MNRSLLAAIAAAAALVGCSQQPAAKCSTNADCPRDAICVTGICQKGVPSGGASANVTGAARLTNPGNRITMDAVVGAPVTPAGTAGRRTMDPADNTR